MSNKDLRAQARKNLGGGIFKNEWLFALLISFLGMLIIGVTSTFIIGILLYGPIFYGVSKYFKKLAENESDVSIETLFDGFKDDFSGTFLLGLLINIFTFLWSLLFVIPGIVKAYSYSMAYYIKADHPEYGWKECISESRRIMNGNKLNLFLLDLSFIGWIIVGSFCLGVGVLWVYPYMQSSRANFYESIKNN